MTIYFYVLIKLESLSENFAHSSKFRPAGDGVHDVELLAADDDDVDTARGPSAGKDIKRQPRNDLRNSLGFASIDAERIVFSWDGSGVTT